jgi:hypothetical protein
MLFLYYHSGYYHYSFSMPVFLKSFFSMKKSLVPLLVLLFLFVSLLNSTRVSAQNDTLTVMTYNVLNYGDACQGLNSVMRQYLKTIVAYKQPDLLGLVKMLSVKRDPSDFSGDLPADFCDSMVQYVLNPAGTNVYGYCQYTNEARASDMCVLFYNKSKLTFVYTKVLTVNVTDFDLYKFYYNDPNLSLIKDTTFLYVVLFHTQSGDDPTVRNAQLASTLGAIRSRFYSLPNLVMMGDFNLRSSLEAGYNQLVSATDSSFLFLDAPFAVDKQLTYPASWDKNTTYSAYMTTSTRADASIPNSCGTSGGAKGWYDHMLFSPWILYGSNYISYVPGSYTTVGNDGNRYGISVNDSTTHGRNSSAPPAVVNAVFQLSNKYPVCERLAVKYNTTGISPADPERMNVGMAEVQPPADLFRIQNPVSEHLSVTLDERIQHRMLTCIIHDMTGREIVHTRCPGSASELTIDMEAIPAGIYLFTLLTDGGEYSLTKRFVKLR